jgi:acetolactate synthase-1/3 small subunit
MKKDFTLIVHAENNFSVLNRMINICNRRRVRIKKLMGCELDDPHRGEACFVLHTTAEMAEKVKLQIDKLIEVETTDLSEGAGLFYNEVQATGAEEA